MAQTPSERRAAQRKLAKDLKAGKRILTTAQKGQVKAAKVMRIPMNDWRQLPPEERKTLRDEVRQGSRKVERYIAALDAGHDPHWPDDWETWEWEMYKEGTT